MDDEFPSPTDQTEKKLRSNQSVAISQHPFAPKRTSLLSWKRLYAIWQGRRTEETALWSHKQSKRRLT